MTTSDQAQETFIIQVVNRVYQEPSTAWLNEDGGITTKIQKAKTFNDQTLAEEWQTEQAAAHPTWSVTLAYKPVLKAHTETTRHITTDAQGNDIERTAIVIEAGRGSSVDILDQHGRLAFRLNLFGHAAPDEPVNITADICLLDETLQGTFLAWSKGAPVVNASPAGVMNYTTVIQTRKQSKAL